MAIIISASHLRRLGVHSRAARVSASILVARDGGKRTGTKPARAPNQTRVHQLLHPALDGADAAAEVVGERHLFAPAGAVGADTAHERFIQLERLGRDLPGAPGELAGLVGLAL